MNGVRIDVIAPSGAVLSRDVFEAALARLRSYGAVVRSRLPETPWMRFSDTDEGRLAQIHDAARADDVDIVMIARGGYGLSRLLDRIEWPLVAASVRRGVRWVGFSDFTAFQLALLATTGAQSWAGPAVYGDFGESEPDTYTLAQFRSLLDGRTPRVEWSSGAASERSGGVARPDGASRFEGAAPSGVALEDIALGDVALGKVPLEGVPLEGIPLEGIPLKGVAVEGFPLEGRLWGGNLAMIASLVGTRWLPEIDGGLLFVEDVAEPPYRIERMLLQLLHTGVLGRQRAILFGSFTDWKPSPHDNGFDIGTVANHLSGRLGIPVIEGLPFGHIRRRAVLGVGQRYRLERVGAHADGTRQGDGAGSFDMAPPVEREPEVAGVPAAGETLVAHTEPISGRYRLVPLGPEAGAASR